MTEKDKKDVIEFSDGLVSGTVMLGILLFSLYLFYTATLQTPIIFGDEGYHAAISRWIGEKNEIPVCTPLFFVSDKIRMSYERPPFMHLVLAGFSMPGWNELIIKALMPLFSILSAIIIYLWVKDISTRKAGVFAAFMFLSIPTLVTHTLILYADAFFIFLLTFSLFSFHLFVKNKNKMFLVMSGITAALLIMTKTSGPIIALFYVLYWIFSKNKIDNLKPLLLVAIVSLVVLSPWVVRDTLLYGEPPYGGAVHLTSLFPNQCAAESGGQSEFTFAGKTEEVSTELSLFKFGIMNFINFAYGSWIIIFLFVGGIGLYISNKDRNLLLPIAFFVACLYLLNPAFHYGRVEDSARYILPLVIPICVLGGVYAGAFAEFFRSYQKYIPHVEILIVMFLIMGYGMSKATEMSNVKKNWSPGFIEAAEWVKENTPEDSGVLSLWVAQTVYWAERNTLWNFGKLGDVLLSGDDSIVMPILKEQGIDYIFVNKYSISQTNYEQSFPVKFINYVSQSKHFEKVYDNQGATVYKVNYEVK